MLLDGRGTTGVSRDESSSIDLVPTLLGILDLDARTAGDPVSLPGRDLSTPAPADSAPPRFLYAESAYGFLEYGWAPLFASRRKDLKLVRAGSVSRWFDLSEDPGELAPGRTNVPKADEVDTWMGALAERSRTRPGLDAGTGDSSGSVDAVQLARLRALGYAAGAGVSLRVPHAGEASALSLPDPHEKRAVLDTLQEARTLSNEGFPASSIRKLAGLTEADPSNPTVALLHGLELRKLARRVESEGRKREVLVSAREELRRATELRPAFTAARNGLAAVAMQLALLGDGDMRGAFELVRETIERGHADADTWFHMYLLRVDHGSPVHDPRAAEVALTRCLEIDPDHVAGNRASALAKPR